MKLEGKVESDLEGLELVGVAKDGTRIYLLVNAGGVAISKDFKVGEYLVISPKGGLIGIGKNYHGVIAEADIGASFGNFKVGLNTGTHYKVNGDVTTDNKTDGNAFVEYKKDGKFIRIDTNGKLTAGVQFKF